MSITTAAMKWTGAGKLIGFYKHFSFAGPRTTTGVGVLLQFASAAIYMFWLVTGQAFASHVSPAGYLSTYFLIQVAGAAIAGTAMVLGRTLGWWLACFLAITSIMMYVASRVWGLPDLDVLVGWWEYPLGTFMMLLAGTLLALQFGVLTKVFITYPNERGWHD